MRTVIAAAVLWAVMGLGPGQGQQSKTAPPSASRANPPAATNSPGSKAGAKATAKAPAARQVSRRSGTSATARSSRTRKTARASTQKAPSPERYTEIQRALIERGYLAGPPTGKWGPDCIEALKRFQQDHNLEATGKLNALTLIALGLGPNRSSLSTSPAVAADGERQSEGKPQ